MRHMAWLHATPEGSKKSRAKSFKELDEEHPSLKLPEIEDAEYLVALLHEAGLVSQTGMGVAPIEWGQIQAWLDTVLSVTSTRYVHDGCGVYIPCTSKESILSTWEITTLKEMSEAYASEFSQASDKLRAAPYLYINPDADIKASRDAVQGQILSVIEMFKKR